MKYLKLFEELKEPNNIATRPDTIQLSMDEFMDLFEKNCKQYDFNAHIIIDRSVNLNNEYFYHINPKKYRRISISGIPNIYTLIMDNEPVWAKYPKRSHSLIGCVGKNPIREFVVIPYDNSIIGVCHKVEDIWEIWNKRFNNLFKMYSMSNQGMLRYFNAIYYDISGDQLENENYSKLKEQLTVIQNYIIDNSYKMKYRDISLSVTEFNMKIIKLLQKHGNLHEFLVDLYSPRKNFSLFTYPELQIANSDIFLKKDNLKWAQSEMWIDSECLLIPLEEFNRIKNKLKK